MNGARTKGQPAALEAVRSVLRSGSSHALLLVGPGGVGKTTLALDLAATLLCTAEPAEIRPCRACRACRLIDGGNHPDLHRLAPDGAGGQIRIGERTNPDPSTVRGLASALALLPVEGGARVAIVEQAHRMNDDAQSALLKTLEEPPAGVTIVVCADDEERLLPTVRSRCARIRLGPVGLREIESILAELEAIDPPAAAQLGRLAGGRPGVALAYARSPEAVSARRELARVLLDLIDAPRGRRLTEVRELLAVAADGSAAIERSVAGATAERRSARPRRAAAGRKDAADTETTGVATPAATGDARGETAGAGEGGPEDSAIRRPVAAERRRAASFLVDAWRDLARDLAVAQLGDPALVHDPALLDDLAAAATDLRPGSVTAFLHRLTRAGELLEANVSPELIVDGLVLGWPRRGLAA